MTCTQAFIVTNPQATSFFYMTTTLFDHAVTAIVGHPMTFADASCASVTVIDTMIFGDVLRCQVMQADMLTLSIIV